MVGDVCPAVATARQQEARGIRTQHGTAPSVTPTPNYVYPQSGYVVGGFSYPGIDELRKMANGTSNHMGGPMGEAEAKSSPAQVRVLRPSTSTFRAFDKACIQGAGLLGKVFSSFHLIRRADRRTAPWVYVKDLPR
jgi:hypothetical protein